MVARTDSPISSACRILGVNNLNFLTSYSYDALGRIKSTQKPDGSVATVSYSGHSVTATDEAGKVKQSYYDALGRLTAVQEDPNGAKLFTYYGYDVLDNLISVNQSGQTRSFQYDGLSRLRSATNPESGTTSYTYDGANNLLTKTDGRNVQITYQYDLINRLSTKLYNGAVFSTISRDDVKRQATITSPNSNTTYAFDPIGRTTASTQSIAGNNYSFTYQYNAAGLLTTETYPSGRSVATGYDFGGRAAWLQGSAGGVTTNYIGNPNDQNTWVHYWPHGAVYYYIRGNNVWHAASFNRSLQQTESYEANNNDQGQIYFVSCPNWGDNSNNKVYDICPHSSAGQNNGTLKGYDEWHVGLHFNQTFTYDGMNRLTNVTDTGGYTRNFGYDAFGNMSVNASTGINPSALTPNSSDGSSPFFTNNQLKSGMYDGAGNQTLIGSLKIAYDAENHQTSVQDGSYSPYLYAYDGNGQRVLKSTPSNGRTIYVYDAFGQLAAEYSDNGPTPAPCKTCYLGVDHLGSTRIVIDQNAQPVARHDYLPFGEEILANTVGRNSGFASPDAIDQKFTGQERDGETQLDNFQARYFGGALGRFTSPDPANAGADLMNPQSWNAYSYALNNPLANVDPTGRACVDGGSGDVRNPDNYVDDNNGGQSCDAAYDEITPPSATVESGPLGLVSITSLPTSGDLNGLQSQSQSIQTFQPQPPNSGTNQHPGPQLCSGYGTVCFPSTVLQPVNWKKFMMYLSCLAGAPPKLMAVASGSSQDSTDSMPETQGSTTYWGHTPGKQKNGGQQRLNPSSRPEVGEGAANGVALVNSQASCSAIVANMK